MKIIKNEKLIKRNGTIGNWTSLAAVVILGGAMYATLKYPASTRLLIYSGIAFVVGLILTQIGMYMGIRFGRTPRPDEKLDAGLKGLQNDFVMYHYTTPVSHLLVGPAGVWVVMPYHQRGQVTYKKNRWRLSGGGFIQSYMRIFGQEGLGRPDIEIDNEIRSLKKHLSRKMNEAETPQIDALMVFTDDNVEIEGEESPVPAMKLKQVKEFMRQKAKERKLPAETLNELRAALE